MEASIALKKVGKVLDGRTILAGLSLGVERGTLVAIVGPNDAGKSTCLKVLAGIAKPEFGHVFVNGLDVQLRKEETKRIVGYMGQHPNLDHQMTVRENLLFHGALYGLSKKRIRSQIGKLATTFRIQDILDDFPDRLSRGFLKRAMLVRTLMHDPEILLLDEPTGSLDPRLTYVVWEYMQSIRGEKTVVYATQSIAEAEKMHDRIVIMDKGKVVLDGTMDRLLQDSGEYYHFQVHFDRLQDELYSQLSKLSTVLNPSRFGQIFDFYARERRVLFEVIKLSIDNSLIDYKSDRIGLETLMFTSTDSQVG